MACDVSPVAMFFFFYQNKSLIFEDKEMSQSLSMIVSFENATCVGNIALDSWPHMAWTKKKSKFSMNNVL